MLSTVLLVTGAWLCADAQKTSVTIGGAPGKYGEIAFKLWADTIASLDTMSMVNVTLDLIPDTTDWQDQYTAKLSGWDIVIAPYTSTKSSLTVDLVNGAKPVIVWGGAAESIFLKGKEGVFGTFTTAGQYFIASLDALNAAIPAGGSKTIEFIENDSPFSDAVCKGAIAKAEALNFTHAIAAVTKYDRKDVTTETLKQLLAPVVKANPDMVVVCGHEADVVKVVHAMAVDKLCPKALLCTNCLNNVDSWSGEDVALRDHLIMPTQWAQLGAPPGTDGVIPWTTKAEFVTNFKNQASNTAKAEPTYHQASAFLSAIAMSEALKAMNGADYNQATFIANMKTQNLKTIVGSFKPDANGANSDKPMVSEQYQPKSTKTPSIEIIAPPAQKTSDLFFPRTACLDGAVNMDGAAQSALSFGVLAILAAVVFV